MTIFAKKIFLAIFRSKPTSDVHKSGCKPTKMSEKFLKMFFSTCSMKYH